MGDTTISWCRRPGTRARTWNPTQGCALKSDGCRNCYAMKQARRFAGPGKPFHGLVNIRTGKWTGVGRLAVHKLTEPLTWRQPSTVFVNSMSDLFWEEFTNEQIAVVFGVMAACPQHTFQILTKRADRMREWFEWATRDGDGYDLFRFGPSGLLACAWEACTGDAWGKSEPPERLGSIPSKEVFGTTWPLKNVWLGVSVENQDAAEERIPELLRTPAAIRFLSCEPLLEGLRLQEWLGRERGLAAIGAPRGLAQVIAGCESGPGARHCDTQWLCELRDQCAAAGVAYFLKQAIRRDIDGRLVPIIGVGDGSSEKGRGLIELPYLDGVQHAAFPEVPA